MVENYYLVVNAERLLGFYRDARRAAALAARFASARVIAIPREADQQAIRRLVGGNEPIARHVRGKLAMIAFRDPRAFGMTDWAWQAIRKHAQGVVK